MPDLEKLISIIKKRETLVESVPAEFVQQIENIQNAIYREMLTYAKNLEISKAGAILNNDVNKAMTAKLRVQIRKWMRDNGYYRESTEFVKKYGDLLRGAQSYYKTMDLSPAFTDRDLATLSKLRATDLNFLHAVDENLINITYEECISSIYAKTDWRDLAARMKNLHTDTIIRYKGKTKRLNGLLKKYTNTYAFTAYASFDRQIQNIKAAEFGLDHFLYSGGLVVDSRDFCVARAGNIFTKKEIDSWQSMSWTGKAAGRDVWKFLGGFNCQHILSPVTDDYADMQTELETLWKKIS